MYSLRVLHSECQVEALDTALTALETADRKVKELSEIDFKAMKEASDAGAAEGQAELEEKANKAKNEMLEKNGGASTDVC